MITITPEITAEELAELAVKELPKKEALIKANFVMKDLFVGYEWDAVPLPVRLRAGKIFFDKVCDKIKITDVGMTPAKQMIYEHIGE